MTRELDAITPESLEAKWEEEVVRRLRRDGEAHEERREERKVRRQVVRCPRRLWQSHSRLGSAPPPHLSPDPVRGART